MNNFNDDPKLNGDESSVSFALIVAFSNREYDYRWGRLLYAEWVLQVRYFPKIRLEHIQPIKEWARGDERAE